MSWRDEVPKDLKEGDIYILDAGIGVCVGIYLGNEKWSCSGYGDEIETIDIDEWGPKVKRKQVDWENYK